VHLRLVLVAALLAPRDPFRAQLGQAHGRIEALRAGRIVDIQRGLAAREVDAPEGHAQRGLLVLHLAVELVRGGEGLVERPRNARGSVGGLAFRLHELSYAGMTRIRFEGCFSGACAPPPAGFEARRV